MAMTVADKSHPIAEAAAPAGVSSPIQPDGSVLVHIIRPCAGKGRGGHIYEADMLRREAPKFAGWPMFIDHESPEAQRAAGGLPPSIGKIGGEVLESWWDDSLPAEGRFGQGGVVGKVKPSRTMREYIEEFPRLVQTSVNTFAVGIRPSRSPRGNIVEGFADEGSVDWVTKAGAGGKIVQIMEAALEDGGVDEDDAQLTEWLRDKRPAVVEALTSAEHGEEDEVDPKTLLEAFNAFDASQRETVAEAILASDAGGSAITAAVDARLAEVMPQAMEAAATTIEEQTLAKVDARLDQGDVVTHAKAKVTEAALPEAFEQDALARLDGREFVAEKDADDKIVKTARQVAEAAADEAIATAKRLMEAAGFDPAKATRRTARTAVTGNGDGGENERVAEASSDEPEGAWQTDLQEAGISDPTAAYGVKVQEAAAA